MAMNFAPYQSSPPESERAKSPPVRSPTSSPRPSQPQPQPRAAPVDSIADAEDPWAAARPQQLPPPSYYTDDEDGGDDGRDDAPRHHSAGGYTDLESGSGAPRFNDYITTARGGGHNPARTAGNAPFETSLRLPLRVEASLAYLLLPPLVSALLLCFERKSDYVRFHAWQSTLLFGTSLLVHIIFVWTRIGSAILSVADFVLMVYLVVGAWRGAATLERTELPVLGRLASGFVDRD